MKLRSVPLAAAIVAALSPLALAYQAETFTITDPRTAPSSKPPVPSLSARVGFELPDELPAYALPPIDEIAVRAEDVQEAAESGVKTIRYGLGRDLLFQVEDGVWHELGDGRWLWTADVVSSGAMGIRLGIVSMDLPEGAELTVHAPRDPSKVAGPYTGRGPFGDGHVWTPTRGGDRMRVEYLVEGVAAGAHPGRPPFAISRLQHIYRDPSKSGGGEEAAGTCHNDVNCYPELAEVRLAVGGVGTVHVNAIYCSGQLLNSFAQDLTPYFLTANHCLSTDGEAQDAEIFWRYESDSCGGSVPAVGSVPQSAICTLLDTDATSDFTLLMIHGALPNGLAWAGWLSGAQPNGVPGFCIHHPSGEFKRVSFGTYSTLSECGPSGHFRVYWTDGVTDPGSSGAGFFRNDTQQLVGQLHCGYSACGGLNYDGYGRFADTYPHIESWLQEGSDDVLEPNDHCGGHPDLALGTYSNLVVKSTDEDWYERSVPAGAQIVIRLDFTHAYGDIDAYLWVNCGDPFPGAAGQSNTDEEVLVWTNTTGAANTVAWRVYLESDTRNTYSMSVSLTPANDSCAQARELENDAAVWGSTMNATHTVTSVCDLTTTAPDVWYRYHATQTGVMEITTVGSDIDTIVTLYDGCGGSMLTCNDDASPGAPTAHGTPQSYIAYPVQLGWNYWIRVAGYAGEEGWFRLKVDTDSGAPFCLGDDLSGADCPCNNASATFQEAGCLNSGGTAGKLAATGIADLSNDSLTLVGTGMNPFSTCLYFQGNAKQNNGAGAVFGDGLRCAGGTVIRLDTRTNEWNGVSQYPTTGDPDVSVRGQVPGAGGSRYYQVWYRNVASFCTPAGFNLTNGYQIFWRP